MSLIPICNLSADIRRMTEQQRARVEAMQKLASEDKEQLLTVADAPLRAYVIGLRQMSRHLRATGNRLRADLLLKVAGELDAFLMPDQSS